jgi:hypothetical protein
MTTVIVTDQAELDAAIRDTPGARIEVRNATEWITVSDSATVWACGSATVRAYDSATVRACDSATVWACGSATVQAYDSATVQAYDSATVRAYDSATVRAYDSATVQAYDSATVRAGSHVAVQLHSDRARITGGVTIDHSALDLRDVDQWVDYHAVERDLPRDAVILFKAVSPDLHAGEAYGRPTRYAVGSTVTAADWRDDFECGGGLHLSPTPDQAAAYRNSEATRFLKVSTPLAGVRPIGDKCKVRTLAVLAEVDINGDEI